ncbi:MAG: hypothetical protein C3F17_13665 [Bradyrhizobiaceae bacterium]|nr:MAG: hypothetical protein C3F17_13665 [Bradyrhizobiaceae bacterium]
MTEGSDLFTRAAQVGRDDFHDFWSAVQAAQRRRLGRSFAVPVVLALAAVAFSGPLDGVLASSFPNEFGAPGALHGFKVGVAFAVLFGGALLLAEQVLMGRRLMAFEVNALGPHTFTFSAAGLSIEAGKGGASRVPWQAIRRLERTERVLMIWLDDVYAQFVPRIAFADAGDEAEVLAAVTFWAPHLALPGKA